MGVDITTDSVILDIHTGISEYGIKYGFEYDGSFSAINEYSDSLTTPYFDFFVSY